MWGYFFFHHGPLWAPKCHFAGSTTTGLANCSRNGRVELCVMKSPLRKQSLRKLSLVIMWGYFLFHHSPRTAPEYHFAESTTTVLANSSKKVRVELCVMKSHIRKQSLRKLLSTSYVRILLLSPWAPMGSQTSLCKIHDNSVSKLFQEGKGGTLCDEVTHQKEISQKASL